MKKTILIIVLFIAVITFGIIEQVYIDNTLTQLTQKSEELLEIVKTKNLDSSIEYIESLKQWWYKKRDGLEFVCPNTDIKDIAREIGEIEGSIKSESYEDAEIYCNVLNEMSKNSKNLLAYKWKNVF